MSGQEPCGCCSGTQAETPATIVNRAGLQAISYRSGTWAQFRASMFDALSTTSALGGLRTRDEDDFTIALLDAWAVVCDILTFYQERIANESYLRTATEVVSVGELAKLIGYKLRPGLAASTTLSFAIDAPVAVPPGANQPPDGAPSSVTLPLGTRAQAVPDPGVQPATFETVAPISARPEWNAIGARLTWPPAGVAANAGANLRLAGISTNLRVGDAILLAIPGVVSTLNRIASVAIDTGTATTQVVFDTHTAPVPADPPASPGNATPGVALNDSFVWSSVKGHTWIDQGALVSFATGQNWSVDALEAQIDAMRSVALPAGPPIHVYAMGISASLFGHNAPDWTTLDPTVRGQAGDNWNDNTILDVQPSRRLPIGYYLYGSHTRVSAPLQLDLDNAYPVVVGDRVVLVDAVSGSTFATTVTAVGELTRTGFLLSAKVTRLILADWPPYPQKYAVRSTRVLVQSAELVSADLLLTEPVGGAALTLNGAYLSLSVGQAVAVTGVRADQEGRTASEVTTIGALALIDGYTEITFDPQLNGIYQRDTVTINANLAPATHGESTTEILGNGDATQASQRFALKQPPLTYVSATTASGVASTLVVRVDGVAWREVEWLAGAGVTDRVFTVVSGVDGRAFVQFGDGVNGARPGTGTNNVVATYRHGTGSAGLARPGQISTLLSRPLGLKAVTNPLAATGAADPETIAEARLNAPSTIKTIDRVVSLEDVADFAAASAGIAKASANWLWDGGRYVACVTVAGTGGRDVVPGSAQYANLLQALRDAGDGTLALALCSYVPRTFSVAATVTTDPRLVATDVVADVRQALNSAFGFDARSFGQPVFASEVVSVMQNVPGVVAVTLDAFAMIGSSTATPSDVLLADAPTVGAQGLVGAQLLTLDPGPLRGVVAS